MIYDCTVHSLHSLVNTIQNNDSTTNKKSIKVSCIIIHRCFSSSKAVQSKVKTFIIVIIVAAISSHTNTQDNGVNDVTAATSVILNKHVTCACSKWSL